MPKNYLLRICQYLPIGRFQSKNNEFGLADGTVAIQMNADSNGVITLTAPTDTLSEDSSVARFSIPLNADAYIELDYKCTVPFFIGLRGGIGAVYTKYYLAGVKPGDHWQKFYLSVKDLSAVSGYSYNLSLKPHYLLVKQLVRYY